MIRQLCKIYGHMDFNDIEEEIIRHPAFNRLADVKQLGYTYKGAYKGASHSRVSHALGTTYLAKQIWREVIKKGYDAIKTDNGHLNIFPNSTELQELESHENLVGVASLLHDIMHTPFAHAIQDHLVLSEILTSESHIESKIDEFNSCQKFDALLREQTKHVLIKSRQRELKYATLIYSLIRGDLGASCIDYVVRDHFEVGFEKLDLYYPGGIEFILVKFKSDIVLALDCRKNTNSLTSVHQLLFTKYKLSERVYFHYTCTTAEAMIGKCLRQLLWLGRDAPQTHLLRTFLEKNQTDSRFIHSLEDHFDGLISYVGKRLRDRQLFKDAFTLRLAHGHDLQMMLCDQFRGEEDFLNCIKLERAIAEGCSLEEKDIIVYCHNPKMFGFDINNVLVLTPSYDVVELNKLHREEYIEIDSINLISKFHHKLWAFYVFCGDRNPKTIQIVYDFCSEIFKSTKTLKRFLSQIEAKNHSIPQSTSPMKLFISYSHKDATVASSIENGLRQRGLDVFRDKTNLRAGHRWPKEIEKHLQTCDALILLWSQHSSNSEWVDRERTYGMLEHKKLVLIRLDETPISPLLVNVHAIMHSDLSTTVNEILRGLGSHETETEEKI